MADVQILLKRGTKAALIANNDYLPNEVVTSTDTNQILVATTVSGSGLEQIVTDISDLQSASIEANDKLEFWDVSETNGIKNKQISFTDLKSSLNIPEGSSDEKVAISSGSTSGYLTDVLQVSDQLSLVQSGSVLSLSILKIDGGLVS